MRLQLKAGTRDEGGLGVDHRLNINRCLNMPSTGSAEPRLRHEAGSGSHGSGVHDPDALRLEWFSP